MFIKETSQMETRVFNTSGVTQLPENTNCLAWSEDGQYLCVGHSKGLSIWSAATFTCATEWSQDRLEMASIQITKVAEMAYLLATIDDMGVARVLLYRSDTIHLLNIINIMEDINNRSICLSFKLSQGGDYGVASVSCNSVVWLEVLHFPLEAWLKELETAAFHKQEFILSEVKWSPVAVIYKIKPLHSTVTEGLSQFFSHCLAFDGETGSQPGHCAVHFLLPLNGESKAKPDLPNTICIWWSGSQNVYQYWLHKATKSKHDKIVCSAVSGCTRYVAVGLRDAVVCVWDRLLGSPLSVLSMTETDSAFSRILFVDNPGFPGGSHYCGGALILLFVMCKSGAVYTIIMGQGAKSHMLELAKRAEDSGDLPGMAVSVPFLQGLVLVMQRNGKMFLQDSINKTNVCSLMLPSSHTPSTPCKAVFALNSKHRTLVLQGHQDRLSKEDGHSQLYIFHFDECEIVKPYIITPTVSTRQQKTGQFFATLEDSCNQYLQERMLTAKERGKVIKQTWTNLQDTPQLVQQRYPDHI